MKNDDLDKDLKRIVLESTALFGDIQEMTKEELTEALSETGANSDEVSVALYRRIEKVVAEFRISNQPVPPRYLVILDQLRPLNEFSQNPDTARQQARRWYQELLSPSTCVQAGEFAFGFHRKEDLTDADRAVLKNAAERLRKRLETSRK